MSTDVVAKYESAVKAREAVEEEIAAYVAELTSGNNVGVSGPLVDAEGFPRADVDVYRVRHVRHLLARKQTDHKHVMTTIEELLPQVFAARSSDLKRTTTETAALVEDNAALDGTDVGASLEVLENKWKRTLHEVKPDERELQPFAVVESVQSESPAETAGLQALDQVLRFGTADAENHRGLTAVKEIVDRNIGSGIRVLVRRDTQLLALELIPQTWRGPGVLGCLLRPV